MSEVINSLSLLEQVLWSFFAVILVFQLFYPWLSFRKLLFYKTAGEPKKDSSPPVSVIICAQNEAHNLERFLPSVLKQDYPNYQVVVVNDCSDDNSEDVLEKFKKEHSHLYYTTVKKDPIYRHGKKLAISLGIKAAKHEHLVFIDADCYPSSDNWLAHMAQHFSDKTSIVLGVSPYEQSKGLLGQIVGYETLQTAMLYTSSALRQKAYMGVGRNMAYTKQLFHDNKGFSGHTHLLSGDDDLFVNKAATKDNVAVELSSDALVYTLPPKYWSEWLKQKRRHMSTGKYYKKRQKLRFTMEAVMNVLYYVLLFSLLGLLSVPLALLVAYIIRYVNNSTIRAIASKRLHFPRPYFFQGLWLNIIVPFCRTYLLLKNLLKPQKFTWR